MIELVFTLSFLLPALFIATLDFANMSFIVLFLFLVAVTGLCIVGGPIAALLGLAGCVIGAGLNFVFTSIFSRSC